LVERCSKNKKGRNFQLRPVPWYHQTPAKQDIRKRAHNGHTLLVVLLGIKIGDFCTEQIRDAVVIF